MLTEITGYSRVERVYVQLLYACNFYCDHCFQGVNLKRSERMLLEEAANLLGYFSSRYSANLACFLGGEPFLYRQLTEALSVAKGLSMATEICTNGFKVQDKLQSVAGVLDELRVSIDGLQDSHDSIRLKGSFEECLKTIIRSVGMGINTSVTMTVTRRNATEIASLAALLASMGVSKLKLHQLRPVGNAVNNLLLFPTDDQAVMIHDGIESARDLENFQVIVDSDLLSDESCNIAESSSVLERVEIQPTGEMYVSCKAVGSNSNAFHYDFESSSILYRPHSRDEIASKMPQVIYLKGG